MTDKDFSICERVPIKHLGLLQSFSYVFVFELDAKTMLAWSDNVKDLCLENFPFENFLKSLKNDMPRDEQVYVNTSITRIKDQDFYVHVSQTPKYFFLELEAMQSKSLSEALSMAKLQKVELHHQKFLLHKEHVWLKSILDELSDVLKADRSLIYKFDSDYSGKVICEHRLNETLESYLELCFPATDIPKIVRDLYLRNSTRFIYDGHEIGFKLCVNEAFDVQAESYDLSSLHSRGVSYFHTEYLKAMGIRSSFSIALIHGESLWGLISFQYLNPVHLDFSLRVFAQKVGKSISQMLALRSASLLMKVTDNLKMQIEGKIFTSSQLNQSDFINNLYMFLEKQLHLVGMAIKIPDGPWVCLGTTPEPIDNFVTWLEEFTNTSTHYSTRSIRGLVDHSEQILFSYNKIAGVLFSKVFHMGKQISLLLFRAPLPETVQWAGKAVAPSTPDNAPSPRRSFEIWTESRQFHSEDWNYIDRKYTWEIGKIILERTDYL